MSYTRYLSGRLTGIIALALTQASLMAQAPVPTPTPSPTPAILANVINRAPSIAWVDFSGKAQTSAAFADRPIIVLFAPDGSDKKFLAQLKRLKPLAEKLQAARVVFLAVFTSGAGRVESDIPFVVASHGAKVGSDFDTNGEFCIAIIGRDSNIDYITNKPVVGQRILDIVNNSFTMQSTMRRQ